MIYVLGRFREDGKQHSTDENRKFKTFHLAKISHQLYTDRFRPPYSDQLHIHTQRNEFRILNHHTQLITLIILIIINGLTLQLSDSTPGRLKGTLGLQLNQNRFLFLLVCIGCLPCSQAVKQIQVPTCEHRCNAFLYDVGMLGESLGLYLQG